MLGKVLFVGGVATVFWCGYKLHQRDRRRADRYREEAQARAREQQEIDACMAGVWSEPRDLIPDIVGELSGPGQTAAKTAAGRLVEVSLTPQAQRNAFAAAKFASLEGATQKREEAIKLILQHSVAPVCDWSHGYLPHADDPRFRDVWESVGQVLDVAELSTKYAATGPQKGSGALVSPGWIHENPAPSAELRSGDFVEVLVDRFSPRPDDESRYAEWAWVRVDDAPPKGLVRGVVTYEAPPGAQPNTLRNSESHGFASGSPVAVPRSHIHRVVHGR